MKSCTRDLRGGGGWKTFALLEREWYHVEGGRRRFMEVPVGDQRGTGDRNLPGDGEKNNENAAVALEAAAR